MKKFKNLVTTIVCAFTLTATAYAETPVKVGIIMPADVEAMHQIIAGFEQSLQQQYKHPIEFKVENAQSDPNLQHSIIMQMRDSGFNLIAPIGTDATQMTIAMVKQQPIVSLAADITDADRAKFKPCNVAVVDDEVENKKILAFIHAAYPKMKNMVLIHSASEKVFPEVKEVQQEAIGMGMQVKNIMVTNLPDMQSAANQLPNNTQAIFILKDSLIVSGIAQLAQIAAKNNIPLITSDDGSVQNGAGFAVGVHENEIGVDGGLLAAQILQGKNACSLPITKMTKLTVFVNQQAMTRFSQPITPILNAAKALGYKVEMLN